MQTSVLAAHRQPSAMPRQSVNERLFACLIVAPGRDSTGADHDAQGSMLLEEDWLAACRDVTPVVERLSPQRALLDLGPVAPEEARALLAALLERVARMGWRVRIGIAPSLILAELAALTVTPGRPLLLLTTPDARQVFLRRVPVTALPHLLVGGPERVTPEMVERLERYGLRRLGDLARLGELALRRQFGAAGAFLAAVAAGRDERPLQHAPPPAEWRVRLRLGSDVAPERALAALRLFAEWAAVRLRAEGRQTRRLRVRLRWECGCARHASLSLRQHTQDAALLAQEFERLLAPLLAVHDESAEADRTHTHALAGLWIALGDFAPLVPSQATFWRTREQRLAAARLAAETLTRRHGRPLLLHTEPIQPDAVYEEERHQLAALPDAEPAPSPRQQRQRGPAHLPDVAGDDPWQTVPQRLHWW